MIVYAYTHIANDGAMDLPCVVWPTAEGAMKAAEAHDFYPGQDLSDPTPAPALEWAEEHERRDGRYPAFVARVTSGKYCVYPIEVLPEDCEAE